MQLDLNNISATLDPYRVADLALFCKLITLQMSKEDSHRQALEHNLEILEKEISAQQPSVESVENCLRNLFEIFILHESVSSTVH